MIAPLNFVHHYRGYALEMYWGDKKRTPPTPTKTLLKTFHGELHHAMFKSNEEQNILYINLLKNILLIKKYLKLVFLMRNVTLFLQVETGPAQLSYSYLSCPQRKTTKWHLEDS